MKCETVYFQISFVILICYVKIDHFEIMTKIIRDNISILILRPILANIMSRG